MVGVLTECIVDTNSPGHPLLTLDGGEHFGRVLESDRSFAQRVANGKQIDESNQNSQTLLSITDVLTNLQYDWSKMCRSVICLV